MKTTLRRIAAGLTLAIAILTGAAATNASAAPADTYWGASSPVTTQDTYWG